MPRDLKAASRGGRGGGREIASSLSRDCLHPDFPIDPRLAGFGLGGRGGGKWALFAFPHLQNIPTDAKKIFPNYSEAEAHVSGLRIFRLSCGITRETRVLPEVLSGVHVFLSSFYIFLCAWICFMCIRELQLDKRMDWPCACGGGLVPSHLGHSA